MIYAKPHGPKRPSERRLNEVRPETARVQKGKLVNFPNELCLVSLRRGGTFVLTLDTGGVWEGTWTGKRALIAGGWSASLVAEGYGTGPGIDGMHMKETETAVSTTPIPFPYTGSVSGYIF